MTHGENSRGHFAMVSDIDPEKLEEENIDENIEHEHTGDGDYN